MRTQFFKNMTNGTIDGRYILRPEPTTPEVSEAQAASWPDDQNPYKNATVYREMLRQQTMARVAARMVKV